MRHTSDTIRPDNLPRLLRSPTRTKPAIYVLGSEGRQVLVKDYGLSGRFFKKVLGRLLVLREKKAYARLNGLPGIPRFIGTPDPLSICMEFIAEPSLEEAQKGPGVPPKFFEELLVAIERIHNRGIVHCDLNRAANVLVGKEGIPHIIDWASCVSKQECAFFPFSFLYRRFLIEDRKAVIKYKLRFAPHTVNDRELDFYYRRDLTERIARYIWGIFRLVLKKFS